LLAKAGETNEFHICQVPILIIDADKSKEEMVETYVRYKDIITGKKMMEEEEEANKENNEG
jgi:hypothetical protein